MMRAMLVAASAAMIVAAGLLPAPAFAARTDLTVGMVLEPPNLDPTAGAAAAIDEVVYANVFEGLTRIGPDGTVLPALAESWEVSDDGLTYTFTLHPDVTFHDGTPFDAQDVVFSLDRARADDSTNAQKGLFAPIASVEAVDPATVKITLKEPTGNFPFSLAWGDAVMVGEESAADIATKPVGTGPFRFVSWNKGDSVVLEKNPDYWGEAAQLDRATFKFIGDPTAAFAAMMAGDVDAFPNFPAPESLDQFRADPRFAVVIGTTEGETILAMNNARAPFDDLRVRQALSLAIDRKAIIDGAMFGNGTPIGSHFAPHNPAYVDLTGLYAHDPAKARELLMETGHPDGFKATLKLPPPSYARRSGEIIAAQLKAVGVDVEIIPLEWAQWLEQVFKGGDFDLTIVAHTEPMDFDIYGRDDYYFHYRNADFKALLGELNGTSDPAKRNEIMGSIQRKIADDAVNVFLFQLPRSASGTPRSRACGRTRRSRPTTSPGCTGPTERYRRRDMAAFAARRLLSLLATLVAASIVIFLVMEVIPSDPAAYMLGVNARPDTVLALREQLGLDQPALQRYVTWIVGVFTGDFGVSYTYRVPVRELIADRLWVSLPLTLMALALTVAVAFPVGIFAASRRDGVADTTVMGLTQLGIAIPNFWFAMLLVMVFSINLRWFSAGGFPGWQAGIGPAAKSLVLPSIALALPQAAILSRIMRASLLDTLHEDFIRTARAKGLTRRQAIRRHGIRNALIPVLTVIGLQFSFLLAGAIIIENVFFLPGLGRLVFQAITQRDLIVVKSVVLILVAAVVAVTFLVDLAYAAVDPRLRRRAA